MVRQIRSVGLIGAGTMGQGIARVVVGAGVHVFILEATKAKANEAISRIEAALDREIARWGITKTEKTVLLSRIECVDSVEGLTEAQLIIEAVGEDLLKKIAVLQQVDGVCPPDVVFATNVSALSVSEMAASVSRPERVIGMHFHHPVPNTKLVEIICGLKTSEETYQICAQFAKSIGKTPINVTEYPGYVTTRCILPFINEAMHIVMEGVASAEDVDRAMCLGFNMERGPLTLADEMGLDQILAGMEHLFRELGDLKYRPCPLLRKLVRAGHLGVKTGQGFFKYGNKAD